MSGIKLRLAPNVLLLLSAASLAAFEHPSAGEQHLLYVASPGIRNYTQYGGEGILVFDIDEGFRFVRRIPTWQPAPGKQPENVKGIAAGAATGRI